MKFFRGPQKMLLAPKTIIYQHNFLLFKNLFYSNQMNKVQNTPAIDLREKLWCVSYSWIQLANMASGKIVNYLSRNLEFEFSEKFTASFFNEIFKQPISSYIKNHSWDSSGPSLDWSSSSLKTLPCIPVPTHPWYPGCSLL